MDSGVSQVTAAFVKAAQCRLCLDEGQLCLCVSVWLKLKGHGRGAVVLGLDRP